KYFPSPREERAGRGTKGEGFLSLTARNRHPTFLRHTKSFVAIPWFLFALLAWFFLCASARAANAPSPARPGGFQFDTKISRPALENYLSRSICIEGMLNGRGPLPDDIRMLTNCGAKYVARALCLWGAENNFIANIKRAKEEVPQVLAADPEIVLEACVFEIVGPRVSDI